MQRPIHILYLSIDGMTEPLGRSQVLSYLSRISDSEHQFSIISFEKPDLFENQKQEINKITEEFNIQWFPFKYLASPPILGIVFGLLKAWFLILKLNKNKKIDVIHCRGNITPLLGISAKFFLKIPFIFDMRGWGSDEKLESGHWKKWYYRPVYYFFKNMETQFFKYSNQIVSLTFAGRNEIANKKFANFEKVKVIPTCVDFNIFKAFNSDKKTEIRAKLGIGQDKKVLIYSGSLGGNYPIKDIFYFFECLIKIYPDAVFIILSKYSDFSFSKISKELNINENQIVIRSVKLTEVSDYICASDFGLIYYEKTYSVIGRSPTKLGEYWASGVSAISMSGIGDLDYIASLFPNNLKLISDLKEEKIIETFRELKNTKPTEDLLRQDSQSYFGIQKGVEFYKNLYSEILACKKI